MRRREPCRLDVVLIPQLQEAVDANSGTENSAGYVGGIGGLAVAGVYPRGGLSGV